MGVWTETKHRPVEEEMERQYGPKKLGRKLLEKWTK